jgi:hypothetical protein
MEMCCWSQHAAIRAVAIDVILPGRCGNWILIEVIERQHPVLVTAGGMRNLLRVDVNKVMPVPVQ